MKTFIENIDLAYEDLFIAENKINLIYHNNGNLITGLLNYLLSVQKFNAYYSLHIGYIICKTFLDSKNKLYLSLDKEDSAKVLIEDGLNLDFYKAKFLILNNLEYLDYTNELNSYLSSIETYQKTNNLTVIALYDYNFQKEQIINPCIYNNKKYFYNICGYSNKTDVYKVKENNILLKGII